MKILLYGGTFDPPHYGHMNNVAAAARLVEPALVLVMPAGVPPHKCASRVAASLRLEMCRCFKALQGSPGVPRLEVSRWEIDRAAAGVPNYSVLTLEWLRREYPGAELYFALGSDMLLHFDEWVRWRDILGLATLVAESREGTDEAALLQKSRQLERQGGRVLLAHTPAMPMASSAIRSGALDYRTCCPPEVVAVVEREKLYGKGVG